MLPCGSCVPIVILNSNHDGNLHATQVERYLKGLQALDPSAAEVTSEEASNVAPLAGSEHFFSEPYVPTPQDEVTTPGTN